MAGNRRWTARDRRFMEAYASKGSKWIALRLGRTPGAVRKKAGKLGIPLGDAGPEPWTCPECGRTLPEKPRGATCRMCALAASRDRAREAAEEAAARLEEDRARIKALERDRQRWYSAASRSRAAAARLEEDTRLMWSTPPDVAATIRVDCVNFGKSFGTPCEPTGASSSRTGREPGWWNLDGHGWG
jgi:hypothetical protein